MIVYKMCKLHANIAAWFAGSKDKRRAVRAHIMMRYTQAFQQNMKHKPMLAYEYIQNANFPLEWEKSEKAIIILIPEHPTMSGGIFSFFSIAAHLRRNKTQHGYDVILMTRPNEGRLTYFRNLNFVNSENVYRFDQILRLKNLKELYLHIPEYETKFFFNDLTGEQLEYFSRLDKVDINILNQNIKLMPEFEEYENLKNISDNLTQSVAHHAYFTQEIADRYKVPTLFLPAYTDLSNYPKSGFDKKDKLIIYSFDSAPFKKAVLEKIAEKLPEFKLLEIKDITFDKFMEYATRCMFSISFGEGFDGYVAQPIYQGGLGMSVYNDDFFPSSSFKQYPVFFESSEEMLAKICERIQYLSTHPKEYADLNKILVQEYNKLYSYEEYIKQIEKLANRNFELFPEKKSTI